MKQLVEIDVIILSYAQTCHLRELTINCIKSLYDSEDAELIKFNVTVLESERSMEPYQYENTLTIYPRIEFGYNRYMNIGIKMTSSSFVCLCNNDLIFHPSWASEILKPFKTHSDIYSASPVCSIHHPKHGIELNTGLQLGYRVRYEISGWCLFFRRDLLNITGMIDENYKFWCADNDYANTLWVLNLKHVLVTSSIVDHLENITLNSQTPERQEELTNQEVYYFDKKWKPRTGDGWVLYDV